MIVVKKDTTTVVSIPVNFIGTVNMRAIHVMSFKEYGVQNIANLAPVGADYWSFSIDSSLFEYGGQYYFRLYDYITGKILYDTLMRVTEDQIRYEYTNNNLRNNVLYK